MSKEMFAYRVRSGVDVPAETIVMLLRSASARAMIEAMVTGTSNRTRMSDARQILDLLIPDPRKFTRSQETTAALSRAHELRSESSRAMKVAEELAEDAWGSVRVEEIAEPGDDADHLGSSGALPRA